MEEKIKTLVNTRKVLGVFYYLWERWQDEKEYEDFNDYAKEMAKMVSDTIGTQVKYSGTKRPFGLKFSANGCNYHLFLKISGNNVHLALKRQM